MVESKLLHAKVEDALSKAEDITRRSAGAANVARVSASLALVRKSVAAGRGATGNLARVSAGTPAQLTKADVEGGVGSAVAVVNEQVAGLEQAVAGMPAEMRSEIAPHLAEVRQAAQRVAKVEEAANTGRDTGPNRE